MEPLIVYCSVPDAKTGATLASALVEEGLCACVNKLPSIMSYYMYEGKFYEEGEELLIIKTDSTHFERLKERIESLHPYEVPEIIAAPITHGNSSYLQWLESSLKENRS